MSETSILAAIRKRAAAQTSGRQILKGIGDDCAVFRPEQNKDLVFTSDFVLQDRHFTLASHTASDVGHLALARSLSDLAAMGADPVFCLVSLAVPPHLGSRWISAFYRGLLKLAGQTNTSLAGGDLATFGSVAADVTCCGSVSKSGALLRSSARAGDVIYVTGNLGASAHALRIGPNSPYWKHHLRPEPRVHVGLELRKFGASACMDLSDGLSLDLHRLCLESALSADLDGAIPTAADATIEDALHGGEDYELLFTAPPSRRIPSNIATVPVARIGRMVRGRPGLVRFAGRALKARGFDHFTPVSNVRR